jgi:His/Glu/Gln/Arg/opine family amino acid ABC transporter permease subunit
MLTMNWISQSDINLLLSGLQMTVLLAFFGGILAMGLGIAIALYRFLMPAPFSWLGTLYVDGIRSMPLVLYLVLVFTVLPVPPFERAVFALATFNAAFIAEVIRSAIQSLDTNQLRAGTLLRMSEYQIFMTIALPQAMARMIPAFINQLNTLLKDTSLVSLGILELAKAGEILMERAWDDAFRVILVVGALYFTLCLGLSVLGQILEKMMRPWQTTVRVLP